VEAEPVRVEAEAEAVEIQVLPHDWFTKWVFCLVSKSVMLRISYVENICKSDIYKHLKIHYESSITAQVGASNFSVLCHAKDVQICLVLC
jgi:hypothetical protein